MTTRVELSTDIPAPIDQAFDLARDISVHERSLAQSGERAIGGRTGGRIEVGETVMFGARYLGIWWTLESRVTAMDAPTSFVDEQVRGPFARFRHEHRFESIPGGTRMTDDWEHVLRFGLIGRLMDALIVRRMVRRLLATRAAALAGEAWKSDRSP